MPLKTIAGKLWLGGGLLISISFILGEWGGFMVSSVNNLKYYFYFELIT